MDKDPGSCFDDCPFVHSFFRVCYLTGVECAVPMQTKTLGHDGNSKGISRELRLKREFSSRQFFSFPAMFIESHYVSDASSKGLICISRIFFLFKALI